MELKIVYLDPRDLKPYERNARKHGEKDVEQLKESIRLDGFNDPIGVWGDNNLIVEGHGRQIAAIELHMDKVPCIRLDHLTDTQRRDYAIRHNRTAELSGWNWAQVEKECEALELEGFDTGDLFNFEAKTADWFDREQKDGKEKDNGRLLHAGGRIRRNSRLGGEQVQREALAVHASVLPWRRLHSRGVQTGQRGRG